jgi:hypothetical protein
MEKTVEYWKGKIAERVKERACMFLEHWEDENSYEIYTTDEMNIALVGADTIATWDKLFSDDCGRNWALHLYAYVKDPEVEYEGVLYYDVERGNNNYAELNIEEAFEKALTQFILEYNFCEKHTMKEV